MIFNQITENDYVAWKLLISELWELTEKEVIAEFNSLMTSSNQVCIGCYDKELVGMVFVSIRTDYVNGTSTSPVGYIEGIVVTNKRRKEGIASRLLKEAEKYSISRGCTEMGSDLEIDNEVSLQFHIRNGYIEQERVICLSKKI
jgi:aminoglycoside 6'-N-acetyltransferase I